MPLAIAIIAILIVGALVGTAFGFAGGAFIGIPIVFVLIGAILGREAMQRQRRIMQMKRFRREARAQQAQFNPQDRRTVV
jgi:hypothetical protein